MLDELMQLLKTLDQSLEAPDEMKSVGDLKVLEDSPSTPQEEVPVTLLDGCCYMPPVMECARDLCRICLSTDTLDSDDCDYYIGTLCHLMMHHLCLVLDACDCFDESTALRECCVSLLQNLDTIVAHAGTPDKKMLLECSIKLAKCCKTLSDMPMSGAESFDACMDCLHCCLDILSCLKCNTAHAKLMRCVQALSA